MAAGEYSPSHVTRTAVSSSDHRPGLLPDPPTRSDPDADAPAAVRIRLALFLAGFATFSLLYSVQPLLPEFARAFKVDPATASLPLSLATGALALAILVLAQCRKTWAGAD